MPKVTTSDPAWGEIGDDVTREVDESYEVGEDEAKLFSDAFDRIVATALPADQSRENIKQHMEGHGS